MRLKYLSVLGAFLILAALLLNVNFISAQTCFYTPNVGNCQSDNGPYTVLRISGETNAHAAVVSDGSYVPGICCDFGGGDTTCDGNNKFLGLSSSTNAHAERPEFSKYNNICYSGFKDSVSSTNHPGGNYTMILSISSEGNAHTGKDGEYSRGVYAIPEYADEDCELTNASWQFEEVSEEAEVDMIVEGLADRCSGVEISFEILRDDGEDCASLSDCEQPENVTFGSEGDAIGTWTANPGDENNNYTFVARVVENEDESQTSGGLRVLEDRPDWCKADIADGDGRHEKEISLCGDYETQSACNAEQCITAVHTVQSSEGYGKGDDFCDEDRNCECYWNPEADEGEKCDARWSTDSDVYGGTCTLKKQDVEGSCADGDEFITFSYTAEWEWHGDGEEPVNGECEEGWVLDDDGLCYSDEEGQKEDCEDGSRVAMCPAEIALPFFNVYSFLITVLLIVAAYLVWNMVKSEKKTHKKSKSGSRKKRKK